MEAFTLNQLVFANKIMFPSDFQRLWEKYTNNDKEASYMAMLYKKQFGSNLFSIIREYDSEEMLVIFTKMIQDILS